MGFDTGLGEAIPIVSAITAQASAVPTTKRAFRLRDEPVIAVTPRVELREG
jgi:hypothetical protein